jgi:hypothetical protein
MLSGIDRASLSELPQLLRHLQPLLAMIVLVSLETTLLFILSLLVAGMLRTHADIMRALNLAPAEATTEGVTDGPPPNLTGPPSNASERLSAPAAPLDGVNLVDLQPVAVEMKRDGGTLLGFLSSGCLSCVRFWTELSSPSSRLELPPDARLILVTKDPSEERVARLREMAPSEHAVVMSSQAWEDYDVPGAPYFVWIDGSSATVRGVGASDRIEGVLKLLSDQLFEESAAAEEDRELMAAGVYPGDQSLYSLTAPDPSSANAVARERPAEPAR